MKSVARIFCACVLITLVLASRESGEPALPTSAESSPTGQQSPTDEELARAVALARQEVESEDAAVTSATVTAEAGTVSETNTGYQCSSGRLINIKLIGSFPHIVTTGTPIDLHGPGPTPNFTVHAVVLTVDAASGHACLIAVQTGTVEPEPGATGLDID